LSNNPDLSAAAVMASTRLFPRLDGASGGFVSDLVSNRDKATTELFGKLSKI
jgi:hypothetical protein